MSDKKLVPVCLDLLMCPGVDLFDAALELLTRHLTPRAKLVATSKQLVMVEEAEVKDGELPVLISLSKLEDEMAQIEYYMETYWQERIFRDDLSSAADGDDDGGDNDGGGGDDEGGGHGEALKQEVTEEQKAGAELRLKIAIAENNVSNLLKAIDDAETADVDSKLIESGKRRKHELEKSYWRVDTETIRKLRESVDKLTRFCDHTQGKLHQDMLRALGFSEVLTGALRIEYEEYDLT